jgi:AcrR family transcriptional regulator
MANDAPRTKEKEVRTAEIEQAARKVFLSRGFQSATIQEIAERAGIAKGTVYLYYKSKDDLYAALLLPALEFLNERFSALLAEVERGRFARGGELFDALADVFLELLRRDPEVGMIYEGFQVGTFVTSISKETLTRMNGFARRNFQTVRAVLQKGIELGLVRDLDLHRAVDAIWGLLVGVAQVEWSKLQTSGKDHLEGTLRYALAMMYGGVSAAPAGKPERKPRRAAVARARGRNGRTTAG